MDPTTAVAVRPPPDRAPSIQAIALTLQRTAGNRATARVLARLTGDVGLDPASGPDPAAGASADERPMLHQGDTGPDVEYAQGRLNDHADAGLDTDGIFGPLTLAATRSYQDDHTLVVDGIIGPHTWASLDGPVVLGGGKGGKAGGAGSTVLKYDTGTQTFSAPPRPSHRSSRTSPPSRRVGISVRRSLPGGDQPRRAALPAERNRPARGAEQGQLGDRARRDHADRTAAAGGEGSAARHRPRPGPGRARHDPGRRGRQRDGDDRSRTLPTATQYAKLDDAKAGLIATYGFSSVEDDTSIWSLPELNKVAAALARVDPADRPALKGVELVRVSTLNLRGQSLSGEFTSDESVSGSTVVDERKLLLADMAFRDDATSFIGGASRQGFSSFETILHEIGHAIERMSELNTQAAQNRATASYNVANAATNTAAAALGPADHAAVAKLNAYTGKGSSAAPKLKTEAQAYNSKVNAVTTSLNAMFSDQSAADPPPSEVRATAAIAARNKALAGLTAGNQASSILAPVVSIQDDWFKKAIARATAWSAMKAAQATTAATRTTITVNGKKLTVSKRLAAFVGVVNANNIPPLTKYAADDWPSHPEEFFAEANSLFLNDPDYLKVQAQPLYDFFASAGYRI